MNGNEEFQLIKCSKDFLKYVRSPLCSAISVPLSMKAMYNLALRCLSVVIELININCLFGGVKCSFKYYQTEWVSMASPCFFHCCF